MSINQGNEPDLQNSHATILSVPKDLPSLVGCTLFYKKHMVSLPNDLSVVPTKVTANINLFSSYEVCLRGVEKDYFGARDVGFLQITQCQSIFEYPGLGYYVTAPQALIGAVGRMYGQVYHRYSEDFVECAL